MAGKDTRRVQGDHLANQIQDATSEAFRDLHRMMSQDAKRILSGHLLDGGREITFGTLESKTFNHNLRRAPSGIIVVDVTTGEPQLVRSTSTNTTVRIVHLGSFCSVKLWIW